MKKFLLCAGLALAASSARAQSAKVPPKAVEETARILQQARASVQTEAARVTADKAADQGRMEQLAAEAKAKIGTVTTGDAKNLSEAADRRLEPALSSASTEGRAIIAQSAAAPALRAPSADDVPKKNSAAPATAPGGKAEEKKTDIDIRSEGAVYFDSAQQMAIFTDDVVVVHPQFHLTGDKLEVWFLKDSEKKAADGKKIEPAAAQIAPPATGEPPKAEPVQTSDAQLKQAIATGRKVVIQKLDENGEPQVGVCRHCTYIGENGDIILREMPQVQRGKNVIIARDPSTYMVLKQNGELKVHGPADTKIEQKADPTGKPQAPGLAPAGAVPGTPVLTPKKPAAQ